MKQPPETIKRISYASSLSKTARIWSCTRETYAYSIHVLARFQHVRCDVQDGDKFIQQIPHILPNVENFFVQSVKFKLGLLIKCVGQLDKLCCVNLRSDCPEKFNEFCQEMGLFRV